MTPETTLPLWCQILVAALALGGAIIAFLGSMGLWRLGSYFERVHAPPSLPPWAAG